MSAIYLILAGLAAGFIDSIAGGGGLITLPTLSLALTPGPWAVGTNKIVGFTGAFVALLVYFRAGHFRLAPALKFGFWVMWGSLCGSLTTHLIPLRFFPWLIVITVPIILFVVWRRELWIESPDIATRMRKELGLFSPRMILPGLLCGFYDGAWGPGGGTFMLLGLLFGVRLPLFIALAVSKFVNTVSAGTSLISFSIQGYVDAKTGLIVASGMAAGALVGSRLATKRAEKIVRPLLAVVALLLVVKIIADYFR